MSREEGLSKDLKIWLGKILKGRLTAPLILPCFNVKNDLTQKIKVLVKESDFLLNFRIANR